MNKVDEYHFRVHKIGYFCLKMTRIGGHYIFSTTTNFDEFWLCTDFPSILIINARLSVYQFEFIFYPLEKLKNLFSSSTVTTILKKKYSIYSIECISPCSKTYNKYQNEKKKKKYQNKETKEIFISF